MDFPGLNFPSNLFVFSSIEELMGFDFNTDVLGSGFVIKANHGSGMNLIFNKGQFPTDDDIKEIGKWFSFPSHLNTREKHYKFINRKVFIEELIHENIFDYKFHCFNEEPMFVQVDVDRFKSHKRNIYDLQWELKSFDINYPKSSDIIPRPIYFETMIDFSVMINKIVGHNYLRIDFYETVDKVYLGEITFHPGGGVEPFDSYESDFYFGSFFTI